ncbi:MAG TPA: hypothetical protein DCO79_14630 [Spirochaeta sp.]|nr:hypothetical protein [Spirochaeta sp.]
MTIESNVADMIAKNTYAAGERIELLQCSAYYTAAVTALKLIVINNATDATAEIAFNEGLPADGLLNEGGITGLDWQGSTLYLSGDYGLAALDVSTANTLLTWE